MNRGAGEWSFWLLELEEWEEGYIRGDEPTFPLNNAVRFLFSIFHLFIVPSAKLREGLNDPWALIMMTTMLRWHYYVDYRNTRHKQDKAVLKGQRGMNSWYPSSHRIASVMVSIRPLPHSEISAVLYNPSFTFSHTLFVLPH